MDNVDPSSATQSPSGAGTGNGLLSEPTSLEKTASAPQPASITPPMDAGERISAADLRSAFNTSHPKPSIRSVTPDVLESGSTASSGLNGGGATEGAVPRMARGLVASEDSPRGGGVSRRQGMVFNDAYVDPYDEAETVSTMTKPGNNVSRPRTRTMDPVMLAQRSIPIGLDHRHRVGSFSSSGSPPQGDDFGKGASPLETMGFPSIMTTTKSGESLAAQSATLREKKPSRRLMKRHSSRPTSPLITAAPSIDSLPFAIPTSDPNTVLALMNTLKGNMRGEIEYQGEAGGPWYAGVAYIDPDKGCLMFDPGQNGPFHIPIVSDLRGCRVLPVEYPESGRQCLELVSTSPIVEILVCPLPIDEIDLWLSALLAWQQLKPISGVKLSNGTSGSPVAPVRPELKRRGFSSDSPRGTNNTIKVGKIMLWDKGLPSSARALIERASTKDLRSPSLGWKRVSCLLQDNGDFKLLAENDISILSIIELSQLSRCAIQQLDRTVLGEEFSIAVYPIYAKSATRVSIFKPVYFAIENRVHFEVWLTLLRAFTVPDIYCVDDPERGPVQVTDVDSSQKGEIFRVERTINVRVTEAKVKAKSANLENLIPDRGGKADPEAGLVANYLAEVILDNQVRARTTMKMNTKNPFWREDCDFSVLPPTLPLLSVLLKRVEDNLETAGPHLQASPSPAKMDNLPELICGAVDVPLHEMEAGKDHESWYQIEDEKKQAIGSLLMKVTHEELVVLLAREYAPLSEVLHRFSSGLTTMIAGALPGQLRRVAGLFLNVFQVSGSVTEWLKVLVEDEIDGIGNQASIKKYRFGGRLKSNDSGDITAGPGPGNDRDMIVRDMSKTLAGEANLLFRGNSLLTQSLEFHMRRLGKDFLESILLNKINEINDMDPDCEVDPSRLAHGSGNELDLHWNKLLTLTTEVWQGIAAAAEKVPPEIRHILKFIRAVAEDRYGDFLRLVGYTSVSGFLFLRFICAAILSPKLFGLLRDHPRPKAQRTLTLITKALQKMANLSTFQKREEWMEPMNKFLNAQRTSFKEFVDKVCDIPADQSTMANPASYSTPLTIMSRLSPSAREGFPSLPYLIDSTRSFARLVKLWVDLKPQDAKRNSMDGDLLIFNDICVALQARSDACLAKVESVKSWSPTLSSGRLHPSPDLAELLEQAAVIDSLSTNNHYHHPLPHPHSMGSPSPHSVLPVNAPTALPPTSNPFSVPAMSSPSQRPGEAGPPGSSGSGSDAALGPDDLTLPPPRRSRDPREVLEHRKSSATHALGQGKGKVGRTILSGIRRIGGRSESPDSKGKHDKHDKYDKHEKHERHEKHEHR